MSDDTRNQEILRVPEVFKVHKEVFIDSQAKKPKLHLPMHAVPIKIQRKDSPLAAWVSCSQIQRPRNMAILYR